MPLRCQARFFPPPGFRPLFALVVLSAKAHTLQTDADRFLQHPSIVTLG